MTQIENLLSLSCSEKLLDRDVANFQLCEIVPILADADISSLESLILDKLSDLNCRWEQKHGCLNFAKSICKLNRSNVSFRRAVEKLTIELFVEDDESRVRLIAAELLGILCQSDGVGVYLLGKERIYELISDSMKLKESTKPTSASLVLHDTAGWGCLETSMKCLQHCAQGCGLQFMPHFDNEFFDLVQYATSHHNRFVRETAYALLTSMGDCMKDCADPDQLRHFDANLLTKILVEGLADNWSQVRLAASVAVRIYLANCPDEAMVKTAFSSLVPSMCLNRFYLADGVRIYSNDTWIRMTKGRGVELVGEHLPRIVDYYAQQSEADNHAVREAACLAISELVTKLDRPILCPQTGRLFSTLIRCFQDESWPVRDSACTATARFLQLFPDLGRSFLKQTILPLFLHQLHDCIPSVRQAAASGLVTLMGTYGTEAWDWVLPRLKEGLAKVSDQPVDASCQQSNNANPGTFRQAKHLRDNDPLLHTDKTLYSCGSLAPKMGKLGADEHQFRRPSLPWQIADGSVQLVGEMSTLKDGVIQSSLLQLTPACVDAVRRTDYVQHVHLLTTVCTRLVQLMRQVGKARFRPFLQPFLDDVLAKALFSDSKLANAAAEDALKECAAIFGPSILRARVEMTGNGRFLDNFDRIVRIC